MEPSFKATIRQNLDASEHAASWILDQLPLIDYDDQYFHSEPHHYHLWIRHYESRVPALYFVCAITDDFYMVDIAKHLIHSTDERWICDTDTVHWVMSFGNNFHGSDNLPDDSPMGVLNAFSEYRNDGTDLSFLHIVMTDSAS